MKLESYQVQNYLGASQNIEMLSSCYFRFVIKRKFSFIRRLPSGRVEEKDLVQREEWN